MPINQSGEYIRDKAAPGGEANLERKALIEEAAELARQQDTVDDDPKVTTDKKAEMRKRLLGEQV